MEEKDIKTLEKYIGDYHEKVTADNAQQCMENFDENWKTITAYSADDTPELQSKYGLALVIFSVANYESPNISEKYIAHLSELIYQYDTDDDVKYKFKVFLHRSLRHKKHTCKGLRKWLQKISTFQVVFFSPPLQAPPSHSAVAFQPTTFCYVRYSQQVCRLVFLCQAFAQLSFAATLAPHTPTRFRFAQKY